MPPDCSDTARGAEETALWTEGLLHKPEYWSSDPRHPYKMLGGCGGPSVISVLEAETRSPQSWLASWTGGNRKFGVQQDTLLQQRRWRVCDPGRCPLSVWGLFIHMHPALHVHPHM